MPKGTAIIPSRPSRCLSSGLYYAKQKHAADHKVLEYPSMKCRSLRSGFSIPGYTTMFHMVCRPIFERTIAAFLLRNRISDRGHAYPRHNDVPVLVPLRLSYINISCNQIYILCSYRRWFLWTKTAAVKQPAIHRKHNFWLISFPIGRFF